MSSGAFVVNFKCCAECGKRDFPKNSEPEVVEDVDDDVEISETKFQRRSFPDVCL